MVQILEFPFGTCSHYLSREISDTVLVLGTKLFVSVKSFIKPLANVANRPAAGSVYRVTYVLYCGKVMVPASL